MHPTTGDLTEVADCLEPWFNVGMLKTKAIDLLGGSVSAAAKALGVSYQAVDKWPDELPPRIAERVMGVYARDKLPELSPDHIGNASLPGLKTAEGAAHG